MTGKAPSPEIPENPAGDGGTPFDQGVITTRTDGVLDRLVQPVGWLVMIVAVISAYEVFCRYVLDAPTTWVHETSTFLIAVVFLIGGVRAMARNQHVQISLMQFLLPRRHRRWLRVVNSAILALICLALSWVSALTAWHATHARPGESFYFERSGTFWNPPYPAWIKITLFVVCVLLTVQAVAQLARRLRAGGAENEGDGGGPV